MTDHHVHIGQYRKAYYYAGRVFSALKAAGVDEAWFSSTTSCVYCKESGAARADRAVYKSAPSARELYEAVQNEVLDALKAAKEIGIRARALYWLVPDIHFAKAAALGQAMESLPYAGFKIHPRAQKWDLGEPQTMALAEEAFSYADGRGLLLLIHCDEDNPPSLFEPLIARYPRAAVQLAHSRPLSDMLAMLRRYPNTACDTAMADAETIAALKKEGFADRIRRGTDFPITHYLSERPERDPTAAELLEWILARTEKN